MMTEHEHEHEQDEVITLVDEEGAEHDFAVIDIIEVDDSEYAILLPVEEENNEAIILKFDQERMVTNCWLISKTMRNGKKFQMHGRK